MFNRSNFFKMKGKYLVFHFLDLDGTGNNIVRLGSTDAKIKKVLELAEK